MKFRGTSIEYVYRVRIFGEEGRRAAEVPDMPTTAYDIVGRTVYPDGRQVEFNDRKDFAEREKGVGGFKGTATHIVAPGITSDCVMEVSWTEKANGTFWGLPYRYGQGLYAQWILAGAFPTRLLVVEVVDSFPLAWSLIPGTGAKPDVKHEGIYRIFTFRDLPMLDVPAYGFKSSLNLPTLVMYYQPTSLYSAAQKDPGTYWNEVSRTIYKDDYEQAVTKNAPFQDLAAKLLSGLPAAPGERAGELLVRLNQTVANLSLSSYAEDAALPKTFWDRFDSKDLDEVARIRKTNNRGMQVLYYHLLKSAGLTPKIGKIVDREKGEFLWNQKNPWQFHHDLIGVDLSPGVVLWMDPTLRYAAPGVIHPDYTGVSMLQIDTSTWKATESAVGGLNHLSNARKFTYSLELAEDGDNLEVQAQFSGYPEYAERYSYMPLDPREQGKKLRKKFEEMSKNMVISDATVMNADDAQKNVSWSIKGFIEREPGRSREVYPFPGMPWPLWVPSQMDQVRTVPIVPPYLSTQVALSRFIVPSGFTPTLPEGIRHDNEFGTVIWWPTFDPATREVKVVLRAEIKAAFRPAADWEKFKSFLGWIETACRRQIVLAKER